MTSEAFVARRGGAAARSRAATTQRRSWLSAASPRATRCARCRRCPASPPTTSSTPGSPPAAAASPRRGSPSTACAWRPPSTRSATSTTATRLTIFNGDVLDSVSLMPGAAPARYADRVGAVLAVRTREGRTDGFHGKGQPRRGRRLRDARGADREEGLLDRLRPPELPRLHHRAGWTTTRASLSATTTSPRGSSPRPRPSQTRLAPRPLRPRRLREHRGRPLRPHHGERGRGDGPPPALVAKHLGRAGPRRDGVPPPRDRRQPRHRRLRALLLRVAAGRPPGGRRLAPGSAPPGGRARGAAAARGRPVAPLRPAAGGPASPGGLPPRRLALGRVRAGHVGGAGGRASVTLGGRIDHAGATGETVVLPRASLDLGARREHPPHRGLRRLRAVPALRAAGRRERQPRPRVGALAAPRPRRRAAPAGEPAPAGRGVPPVREPAHLQPRARLAARGRPRRPAEPRRAAPERALRPLARGRGRRSPRAGRAPSPASSPTPGPTRSARTGAASGSTPTSTSGTP